MKIAEIFMSICGEGITIGIPALFVRLYGCNLSCEFCDTQISKYVEMTIDELVDRIKSENANCVCWTGGEPTMQLNEMLQVIDQLPDVYHFVETNGTIINSEIVSEVRHINQWIISPKSPDILNYWVNVVLRRSAWQSIISIKLVISSPDELETLPEGFKRREFFVQPKLMIGDDPVEKYKELAEALMNSGKIYRRIKILPQLHKIVNIR
jgi:7-carboxy-7-deazaguanine synthase